MILALTHCHVLKLETKTVFPLQLAPQELINVRVDIKCEVFLFPIV
jgi:hypothetical protein